jgi:putative Ca2+/H+ antiporter (TMEM165/GDT1 family)
MSLQHQRSGLVQQHTSPQPLPTGGAPPVPNDRRHIRLSSFAFIGFALALEVLALLGDTHQHSPILLVRLAALMPFAFILCVLVALGMYTFLQARKWDAANDRRQQAVIWGTISGVPLASPPPVPNGQALPAQFTIKLKVNWVLLAAVVFLLVGVVFFFHISVNLVDYPSLQMSYDRIAQDWIAPFAPVLAPTIKLLWPLARPQRIEVSPDMLRVRHPGFDWRKNSNRQGSKWHYEDQMIDWSEARLFAIRDGAPGASTIRYELSGSNAVVTFVRIVRPRWWSLYRPAQPFADYNAQMEALLAEISARTGRLLYDVR